MTNLINFLENVNDRNFKMNLGSLTINSEKEIIGYMQCRKEHLQPLKNLGVNFDFSKKRIGMQPNQKSLYGTGNDINILAWFDFKTYKKIYKFFRTENTLNMSNNNILRKENFPFSEKFKG